MIHALLFDPKNEDQLPLEAGIQKYCPQVRIEGKAATTESAFQLIANKNPDLLFVDISKPCEKIFDFLDDLSMMGIDFIIVSPERNINIQANHLCPSGFIFKPIRKDDLIFVVQNAYNKIIHKGENQISKTLIRTIENKIAYDDIIGVPTMDGFDFFKTSEIVRCEGMQKCTQIVTEKKSNIISSYNLGEFRKILEPKGFFSPHKSHLINLKHIRRYNREGYIYLSDGMKVPLARRKKVEFLEAIVHI